MNRKLFIALGALLVSGCGNNAPADAPVDEDLAALSGEAAYQQYCASCHDTGKLGAPIVGKQSDWENRSKLWQAVLMDHAKTGYLDMPAKGGAAELPDKTVSAAVQYMLERTHLGMPADQ